MDEHQFFDAELEDAPATNQFELVLTWDKLKKEYNTSSYDEDLVEGVITKDDINHLLDLLKTLPQPLKRSKYSKLDAFAILGILLLIVLLPLAIYFSVGYEFSGGRAAFVLLTSIFLFLLITGLSLSCILRRNVNKKRLPLLQEIIAKVQEEIFTKKGVIVTISPFESHIVFEMCWKYARLNIPEDFDEAEDEEVVEEGSNEKKEDKDGTIINSKRESKEKEKKTKEIKPEIKAEDEAKKKETQANFLMAIEQNSKKIPPKTVKKEEEKVIENDGRVYFTEEGLLSPTSKNPSPLTRVEHTTRLEPGTLSSVRE